MMKDEGDDIVEEDKVTEGQEIDLLKWWHVNKSGFPMAASTWEKMWRYVRQVHPDGEQVEGAIRGQKQQKMAYPVVPMISSSSDVVESIARIQCYLEGLQYNHTGTQFFDIKRYRSLSWLMETAKEMIRMSLPIKCLEAFVLSLYLTTPMLHVQRFAISFKSICNDRVHRHVVMGIYHANQFGALGLSRKKDLMNKSLEAKCLTDLLVDYLEKYEHYNHIVTKVKLSLPITHDNRSHEPIPWKGLLLKPATMDLSDVRKVAEKYSRIIKQFTS